MLWARGDLTPGHQSTALGLERLLECLLRRSCIEIGREEAHAYGERAIAFQRETGSAQQHASRNLRHDADAIAALAVGGHRAAMRKSAQGGERVRQYLVRRFIRNARDKAYTTGIMVKSGIEQGGLRSGDLKARVSALSQLFRTQGRRSGSRRV